MFFTLYGNELYKFISILASNKYEKWKKKLVFGTALHNELIYIYHHK